MSLKEKKCLGKCRESIQVKVIWLIDKIGSSAKLTIMMSLTGQLSTTTKKR